MSTLIYEALQKLSPDERTRLEKLTALHPQTAIEDIILLVQRKQQYCLNSRLNITRSNGAIIHPSDIFYKVVHWLQRVREIGDVVVQYDPGHAALPWAAIRFLLQSFINDAESLTAVAEGLEAITKNYTRCRLLEDALTHNFAARSGLVDKLRSAILSFYGATLTYLARAAKFYSTRPPFRFIKSSFRVKPALSSELANIRATVDDVQVYLTDVTAEGLQKNTEVLRKLGDQLSSLEDPILRVQPAIKSIQDHMSAKERELILQWICPVPYWQPHNQHIKELVGGTGVWLQKHASFVRWQHSSTSSMFWLKGHPGSGKTKAAAAFIQSMLHRADPSTPSAPVLYFYCSSTSSNLASDGADTILRSLVRQLSVSQQSGSLLSKIRALYHQRLEEACGEAASILQLDTGESVDNIIQIASETPITIVIDGLDEVDTSLNFLTHALNRIMKEATLLVKVFVTSRPMDIETFTHAEAILHTIEATDIEGEIKMFVQHRVNRAVMEKRLLRGKLSIHGQNQIVQKLTSNADGLFLWPSLHLNNICDSARFVIEEDVLLSLDKLPVGLKETFDHIWDRVLHYEDRARRAVRNVICWLLVARRQLSRSELLAVCTLECNDQVRPYSIGALSLSHLCGSLVMLDETQSFYRFLHRSVGDYFSNRPEFSSAAAHATVLDGCLACYLVDIETVDTQTGDRCPGTEDTVRMYASLYWMDHFQAVRGSANFEEIEKKVVKFAFGAEGLFFDIWLEDVANILKTQSVWSPSLQKLHAVLSTNGNVIHAAATYNMPELIEKLILDTPLHEVQSRINKLNLENAHPVYLSARFGSYDALHILLDNSASPNVTGGHMGNPLQAAAFWGHAGCLNLLLDQGADCRANGRFPSVLDAALAGSREDVLMTLINRQHYEPADFDKILDTACQKGLDAVTKALARSSCPEGSHSIHTYLQKALAYGNLPAVRNWIEKVDDINANTGHYGNSMQAAAFGGNEQCLRLVMETGGSINSTGLYGSPLRAAALAGKIENVKYLLGCGAWDESAVTAAAQNGHTAILHLLLDTSESKICLSDLYCKALNTASLAGQDIAVAFLLTRCGPEQYGQEEQRALQLALYNGNAAVINAFVNHYREMRGITGVTLVKCSLGHGPSLLAGIHTGHEFEDTGRYIDEQYSTAFGCSLPGSHVILDGGHTMRLAARLGKPHIIEQLLDRGHIANNGEDIDTNNTKCLPIEISAAYGQINAMKTFLAHGSRIGRSLVFATRFSQTETVKYILESFPDVEVDLHVDEKQFKLWNIDETSSFVLLDQSALGLAVEIGAHEIFELLWAYKLKSSDPLPTVSLARSLMDGKLFFLNKILSECCLWQGSGSIIPICSSEVEPQTENTQFARDTREQLLQSVKSGLPDGYGSESSPNKSSRNGITRFENRSLAFLGHGIGEAFSNGSYSALRTLLETSLPASTTCNILIKAAKGACRFKRFDPVLFVDACCVDDKTAAVLLEVFLTQLLIPRRFTGHDFVGLTESIVADKTKRTLVLLQTLYGSDMESLDRAVARLCRKAILAKRPLMVADILALSVPARKCLKAVPDIIHDLLDAIGWQRVSMMPYLSTMLRLLLRHGADPGSVRRFSVLARICMRGLVACLSIVLGAGLELPSPDQVFSTPQTFTAHCGNTATIRKINGGRSHCNLLGMTVISFFYSAESSQMRWERSLSSGYADIVYSLLDVGYVCDLEDPHIVAFYRAVSFAADEDLLARLIHQFRSDEEADFIVKLNKLGVLHAAALAGDLKIVKELLKLGADPKFCIQWSLPNGQDALSLASPALVAVQSNLESEVRTQGQKFRTLEELVKSGVSELDQQRLFGYAMVRETDTDGSTKDRRTVESAYGLIMHLFSIGVDVVAANSVHPYLETVLTCGDGRWLSRLFQSGPTLKPARSELLESIKIAARKDRAALIHVLIKNSDDLADSSDLDDITDDALVEGNMKAFYTVKRGHYNIDRARKIPETQFRHTLLGTLCHTRSFWQKAGLERVLQFGANVNLSIDGWTPLTLSLSSDTFMMNFDRLDILLDHGADPNKPQEANFRGQTVYLYPLHLAIASYYKPQRAIQRLLDAGADTSVDGGFGTPLFQLRRLHEELVPLFLSARPSAEEREGKMSYEEDENETYVRFNLDLRRPLTQLPEVRSRWY